MEGKKVNGPTVFCKNHISFRSIQRSYQSLQFFGTVLDRIYMDAPV